MPNDCPSPETLQQFVRGELADDASTQIVAHLDSCRGCKAKLTSDEQGCCTSPIAANEGDVAGPGSNGKARIPASDAVVAVDAMTLSGSSPVYRLRNGVDPDSNSPTEDALISQKAPIGIHLQITEAKLTEPLHGKITANLQSSDCHEIPPKATDLTQQAPASNVPHDGDGAANRENRPGKSSRSQQSEILSGVMVGRYSISRRLGRGGFGTVYLARDCELGRLVAIKIPHFNRFIDDTDKNMYLSEARTLALLDHPAIVPIYDFGVNSDGRCFVVSKFIDGDDLAHLIARGPLSLTRSVSILATVADALHHVHESRLVHRDIKPGNLLVSNDDRVYVADFGLALRESLQQSSSAIVGTPAYMSPEQIRGEGHLMDGRSDQFSLGCVMYELLTGVKPFTGSTSNDVLDRVISHEPTALSKVNPKIPKELNRICLKLLSKLASQRYRLTRELAEELRLWLASAPAESPQIELRQDYSTREMSPPISHPTARLAVIPRGLRAFTSLDSHFFLSLLPGIRDRNGLPPVLSHWKRWVVPHDDAPELHRVGVISGPTGCGKSSLVRAGLLPAIDSNVVSVIIDATADSTETQLAAAIRRRCSGHTSDSLPEWISAIRRGLGLAADKSLLIVIDQFEQWLHSHPEPIDSELVRAIRQCDGVRVQCLILVRDDFWLALNRFMDAVESPLALHTNATMVDLFEPQHAKKVLIEFGRCYERLPTDSTPLLRDQERFVDQAISNLSTNDKVFPVHLALFTEMVKSREWTPATLRQIGGAVGIGAQFLKDAFSATYSPANQRIHEVAARNVLQSLLPAVGTEIKASRRPRADLANLSGYADRPSQFNALIEILETDLKLISASEQRSDISTDSVSISNEQATYQLSHDFLVPSIREWLSARQRETYIGRLHERISEQAGLWSQHREARFLPSFTDWLQARCFLRRTRLSPTESQMLGEQDVRSTIAIFATTLVAVLLTLGFLEHRAQLRASALVDQLQTAGLPKTVALAKQLTANRRLAEPLLKRAIANADKNSPTHFALRVAQLPWDSDAVDEVFQHVLNQSASNASVEYVSVATEALKPYSNTLAPRCWTIVEDESDDSQSSKQKRFCAAQILAAFDTPGELTVNERWKKWAPFVSQQMIETCLDHPNRFAEVTASLTSVSSFLIPNLSKYLGVKTDDARVRFAMAFLAAYVNDPALRTKCFLIASEWQRRLLSSSTSDLSTDVLWDVARGKLEFEGGEPKIKAFDRQRALAAALLMATPETQNRSELRALLKRLPDATVRTCLIHDLKPRGSSLSLVASQLQEELRSRDDGDAGIVAALIQVMGEYDSHDLELTDEIRRLVKDLYRSHRDGEVHSSAEWVLRRWDDIKVIRDLPIAPSTVFSGTERSPNDWMRSPTGQDFILIRGRQDKSIGRDFLIATKEVTIKQMKEAISGYYYNSKYGLTGDCPANVVHWYDAHSYCNWLSEKEGLPACYPDDSRSSTAWIPDETHLSQTGYRLPTVVEWQFACRSGTETDCHLGTEFNLFDKYAWCESNSRNSDPSNELAHLSSPVGLLKPNQWGIFDIFGNATEWCDDLIDGSKRPICGGSVKQAYDEFTSKQFGSMVPNIDWDRIGFRVVRTISIEKQ